MGNIHSPILLALIGAGFTFCATVIGSAAVFFVKDQSKGNTQKIFLGFASGIMMASAVWSLLLPSISLAAEQGLIRWLPPAVGFLAGGLFLFLLDKLLPHQHTKAASPEGRKSSLPKSTLFLLGATLHNIPEGMAIGLAFALAATSKAALTSALVLALGMALQNIPEGATISIPLQSEGFSKGKAFAIGAASGLVELISAIAGAALSVSIAGMMTYLLSFAAGAMIYVVIDELVPEAHDSHTNLGTLGALLGFAIMMVLDVAFS